ncbi:MAG: helix-turn-helix transcriptional regulator [Acidobacteriota bacterium]|nr:helix-turn-helix transcriptional regulator [Acidobacteriota bacterium]
METLDSIGAKVAEARREQGLRQADLASRSGLSRATIDALENGRAGDIGVSRLIRILAALGL